MHISICSLWEGMEMGEGTMGDYEGVARWHYRGGRPIGVVRVLTARWEGRVAGVLVETRPVLNCGLRNVAMPGRYVGGDKRAAARRLNEEVTTVARVVVVPRFRGIGVAEALVRRSLATARTPVVEALAAMGRRQPFFEKAGMRRYDRPMPAESVRLLAALRAEGMVAGDLAELEGREVSAFLGRELVRFWRAGRHPRGGTKHEEEKSTKSHEEVCLGKESDSDERRHSKMVGELREAMGAARRRVMAWPAYFVWQDAGAGLPGLARVPEVSGMREAMTVFLAAGEKRRVEEALRRIHPDPAEALVRWVDAARRCGS